MVTVQEVERFVRNSEREVSAIFIQLLISFSEFEDHVPEGIRASQLKEREISISRRPQRKKVSTFTAIKI